MAIYLPYRIWFIRSILLLSFCSSSVYAAPHPHANDLQVEKIVMVVRHGVRANLSSESMAEYSTRSWPDFGVAPGELTPHGRRAMFLWGEYHRRRLAQQGLLTTHRAIAPDAVRAFSSHLARAQESAAAFLEGFAPGTEVLASTEQSKVWFKPDMCGLTDADPALIRQAVTDGVGMPLARAADHYRPLIAALEARLGIQDGRIASMPWTVEIGSNGPFILPLKLINGMVETVRMQYCSNLPLEQVGFGSVDNHAMLADFLTLRNVNYDAVRHPPYLAARLVAPLLEKLLALLADETDKSDNLVSLFMGHDTNLAAIRSLLGFDWQTPSLTQNDIVPGGMLMFERVRHLPTGERFLRISYHAPTMDQIRHHHVFDDAAPPFTAVFEPSVLNDTPHPSLWPLPHFARLVTDTVQEAARETQGAAPSMTPRVRRDIAAAPSVTCQATPHAPAGIRDHVSVLCEKHRFQPDGHEKFAVNATSVRGNDATFDSAVGWTHSVNTVNPFAQ